MIHARQSMGSRALPTALLVVALGCGRTESGRGSDGGIKDSSSVDTSEHHAEASRGDAAPSCPILDAGGRDGGRPTGRVPVNHRPAGSTCPAQRAAVTPDASPCTPPDSSSCGQCTKDSDCTQGTNGRCGVDGPIAYKGCSYDECFSNPDCEGGMPCECRSSSASSANNHCVTGSNCRVDSDCGPGGYCSPSILDNLCQCAGSPALCGDSGAECFVNSTPVPCSCGDSCGHGYFCHTRCDTCIDDSDCGGRGTCNYDVVNHLWDCSECMGVP